jgi:hypothetical protein
VIRGYSLQSIVDAGLAPSQRWLQDQIRARRIPAHKIGRHWVMTDDDIENALRLWESKPQVVDVPPETPAPLLSLTATSLRRQKAAS